jgi:hypothetical protein
MTILDPHPENPIAIPPPKIIFALADLAECVCALLANEGAGPTCWCGLYPGQAISWEYCTECGRDQCGMGYVRLAGVSAYDSFPNPTIDDRCAKPLAWGVEVGALRCVPQQSDGSIIPPDLMAEVAIGQVLDAAALRTAIKCCGFDAALGAWLPIGPAGGCVGGYWMAFLDVG